jgi:hypothetical protein
LAPSSAASGWNIFDQLQHFAEQALPSTSKTPESTKSSSKDIEYDSDRTDFLDVALTPCPRRKLSKPARIASHYFRVDTHVRQRAPVVRRLWRSGTAKKRARKTSSKEKTANEKLRDIERTPPRRWTSEERELLCVLYRWFESDHAKLIPVVFRAITGSEASDSAVRTQWDGHMYVSRHSDIAARY